MARTECKEQSTYREFISRPEISFWIPILTSIILIVGAYYALQFGVQSADAKADTVKIQYTADILKLDEKMDKILDSLDTVGNNQAIMKVELQQVNTNLEELNALHQRTNTVQ